MKHELRNTNLCSALRGASPLPPSIEVELVQSMPNTDIVELVADWGVARIVAWQDGRAEWHVIDLNDETLAHQEMEYADQSVFAEWIRGFQRLDQDRKEQAAEGK